MDAPLATDTEVNSCFTVDLNSEITALMIFDTLVPVNDYNNNYHHEHLLRGE